MEAWRRLKLLLKIKSRFNRLWIFDNVRYQTEAGKKTKIAAKLRDNWSCEFWVVLVTQLHMQETSGRIKNAVKRHQHKPAREKPPQKTPSSIYAPIHWLSIYTFWLRAWSSNSIYLSKLGRQYFLWCHREDTYLCGQKLSAYLSTLMAAPTCS